MSNIYNQALLPAPARNKFSLPSLHDTTLDAGYLIPVDIRRVLPGDTWIGDITHKIRTFPLKAPAFQQYDVGWFVFSVPRRLLMNNTNWQKFIAEDLQAPCPATLPYDYLAKYGYHFSESNWGFEPQSLANYLGIPTFIDDPENPPEDDTPINLSPFLAYQKIYDEWFRDENLISSDWDDFMTLFGDGGNLESVDVESLHFVSDLTKIQHRAFKKDRFTSAMKETQKGQQVVIPLGNGVSQHIPVTNINPKFRFYSDGSNTAAIAFDSYALGTSKESMVAPADEPWSTTRVAVPLWGYDTPTPYRSDPAHQGMQIQLGDGTGAYIDLTTIPGISVNGFRSAMAIQSFLERLETCGSRYTEVIRGMFGVFTPDARLQRPELIKAWRSSIMIGDVLQQEQASTESSPAGTLRGVGIGVGSGATFKYRAYEHCYLITLVSILPRQSYGQGLPRLFTDTDKYDEFWPLLAHQGEEPILARELFFQPGNPDENNKVFGYQSRYYDFRSSYSRISGLLSPGESLDYWTGSRQFENHPTLSAQFIECRWEDSDQDRMFPATYYPGKSMGYFIASIYCNYKAWRKCPKFATPAIL